ncbi:hypothetical protein A1O3_04770 [Capronia epimyces CBS 606.96]|uniref:Defective in cullin neddylation protein n=1 Tax=Capronia epimyces CBS 606.96 TaxID=1182542 RepID=W9XV41_9EURO|nr:uncharacterized protein A1O3_04770 [Capronia epimyces CBS 606.96]EXJ84103.1 hypothetical protein A1O3_04770 [Capronia epimyces CBS 606.96]
MPGKRKSNETSSMPGSNPPKDKKVRMVPKSSHSNVAATVSTAITTVVGGITAKLPARVKSSKSGAKAQRSKPAGFYQSGSSNSAVSPIQQNLNKLFDQYRDTPQEAPDKIGIEGAQQYLTDLGVDLDEVAHLAICDLLQCPSIGEFERDSFISGWRSVSTPDKLYDTIARQAQYIDIIRKKLAKDPAYFKQVYRNAFKLAKPEGQRSVPMDSAIEFWNMFFREGKGGIQWNTPTTEWLDLWCAHYETHSKRPVNKDLWNMVCELVLKTREPGGESLEWWTEDGAWPMAVDDFVASVKAKRKSEGDTMDVS